MLRTVPDVIGRARRRFDHCVRHRAERGAVQLVVREVHRGHIDGVETGALAQRVFRRGGRQHAAALDNEQRTEEPPRAGRVVRENQTRDPMCRARLSGRVRVLRHQHRGRVKDQTERVVGRDGGRAFAVVAHARRMFRQISDGGEEARRRRRGTVQERYYVVTFDRGRRDDRRLGRRCRGAGASKVVGLPAEIHRGREEAERAHAPATGRRENGQRRFVRNEYTADGGRHTGGHHQLRTIHGRCGRFSRGPVVHVPHVGRVRPGVPAQLQQSVRHRRQGRRARLVGGHAPRATPDHREELRVHRRPIRVRRVADRHVVERRPRPHVLPGNRPATGLDGELPQQRRDRHRHVQGRHAVGDRRRRRSGAHLAAEQTGRHPAGRVQGAQRPGQLDRLAPDGPRGDYGQLGRYVRHLGRCPVHATGHIVFVHGVHQCQVPPERVPSDHVRHQQVHRVLGSDRWLVDPRNRRVYVVRAEFPGHHAQRLVKKNIKWSSCTRRLRLCVSITKRAAACPTFFTHVYRARRFPGMYIVTGSSDQIVKVWLYREGVPTHVGVGHAGVVTNVKMSPDGRFLVSTSADGGIFLWRFPYEADDAAGGGCNDDDDPAGGDRGTNADTRSLREQQTERSRQLSMKKTMPARAENINTISLTQKVRTSADSAACSTTSSADNRSKTDNQSKADNRSKADTGGSVKCLCRHGTTCICGEENAAGNKHKPESSGK